MLHAEPLMIHLAEFRARVRTAAERRHWGERRAIEPRATGLVAVILGRCAMGHQPPRREVASLDKDRMVRVVAIESHPQHPCEEAHQGGHRFIGHAVLSPRILLEQTLTVRDERQGTADFAAYGVGRTARIEG